MLMVSIDVRSFIIVRRNNGNVTAINTPTYTGHSGNFIKLLTQFDWVFGPMNVLFTKVKQEVQNFVDTPEHSVFADAIDVSKRMVK